MSILGLHYVIWIVLGLYFVGMLLLGWWSKRGIHDREGFLVGSRRFGVAMMVMHAFGAGTHPGDVAGVVSKTVERGASGIWISWMWMFGTPFYWIIAPVVRRMRCLTVADYFEDRFGRSASVLYILVTVVSGTIVCASVLLATTRTVQGMMGKADVVKSAETAPASVPAASRPGTAPAVEAAGDTRPGWVGWIARVVRRAAALLGLRSEADAWFLGILLVTTAVFVVYSYWGGIVAAIRTDMAQGLMIIALSFIAIPVALDLVGGWSAAKQALAAAATAEKDGLLLFDPKYFSLLAVLVLCINAPFSMMAQPHLISVTSAGRTEWEGRVGFAYGNVIKRICTMGWCFLALCWLAHLIKEGRSVHADAAFGDSVRFLLPDVLQGLMLACVLAAAMSTGDAMQVTIAGLFSQNVYRRYIRPSAEEGHYVLVTRITGVVVVVASLGFAIAMRESVVESILSYFKLTATVGVSVVMGILWRRMNSVGVFFSTIAAAAVLIVTRYVLKWPQAATTGLPLLAGLLFGIAGSLLSAPPKKEVIERFFRKIYVPIGQEEKLELPFDEAVPPEKRWLTAGGLFLVKPSRQSWVGFVVTVAVCLALVGIMVLLLG
jgi:Na+/proline symporter